MKILLVSHNFAPELTGIGKYSGEMADSLVDRGHEVVVVCAPQYYPEWRVAGGNGYRRDSPRPRLTVLRCPLWVPSRPSAPRRMLHLLSFALSSLPVVLRQGLARPDVVMCIAPSLATAPAAWAAALLAACPAWLHVQDFELDAAFGLGVVRGPSLLRHWAARIERVLLRRFDKVTTISSRMAQRLLDKGVDARRVDQLPNWVDVQAIYPLPCTSAFRAQFGAHEGQTVLLYSGTMNRKQGLGTLIDAFESLPAQQAARMLLVLCGDGEMRPFVEQRVAGRSNIRLLPLQPADRLNELLNAADVHLLPQLPGVADLVMPSKLGAMLASGRPVIATVAPDTEIAMVVRGRGWVVPPGDPDALRRAMAEVHASPSLRAERGAAARAFAARTLDRQQVVNRLLQGLSEVVAPPRRAGALPRHAEAVDQTTDATAP